MKADKIEAIKTMAQRGEPGEREVARKILEEMGIDPDGEVKNFREVIVTYKTKQEFHLVVGLAAKYTNNHLITYYKYSPRRIGIEIPFLKSFEFREDVRILLKEWRKSLRSYLIAFIETNNLHADKETGTNSTVLTEEELQEILGMMRNMKEVELRKKLPERGSD